MIRERAVARLTAPGEPYELAAREINGVPCRVFVNAPPSLRALFADTVSEETFIVYGDERLTFADAYRQASRIAHLLVHECGVRKGDRVAISMRNFPEWMTTFTAVTSIGAIAVAMNALWQAEEMAFGLEDSGAKVLVADQERLDRLAGIPQPGALQVLAARPARPNPGVPALAERLSGIPDVSMPATEVRPDDPATLFYTSGSTGNPKGVVSSHRNVLSALMTWELQGRVAALVADAPPAAPEHQPAALLAVPLFHVTGSHAVYLMSYRAQRKLVSMYKWDPKLAAELIERERVTTFVAPAAMTGDLVRVAQQTRHDLSSLQSVGGGGAPRAPEQVKQIRDSFARAMPGTAWGMTETNAIGAGIAGLEYLERPTSSGRAAPVLDLKVVDDAGRELPAGERGELLVRGTSVFHGYWNRPEVNAEVFTADGWFRTGDVACLDDEGFLYIVDRIKDLIIRGGENIGCGRVEAALLTHPHVYEAAVYAVPDERLGEEVGATVYAHACLSAQDLEDYLADHLARFEIPRYLEVVHEPLPRTASGKILKRELRDVAVAGLETKRHA